MLLMSEGQTPPNPTAGGTIVEGALKLGRPSLVLISDTELRGMVFSPNLPALDKKEHPRNPRHRHRLLRPLARSYGAYRWSRLKT